MLPAIWVVGLAQHVGRQQPVPVLGEDGRHLDRVVDAKADELAVLQQDGRFAIEHLSGGTKVLLETDSEGRVTGADTLPTAGKLFAGRIFPRRERRKTACSLRHPG
jgi:hypothetical protein